MYFNRSLHLFLSNQLSMLFEPNQINFLLLFIPSLIVLCFFYHILSWLTEKGMRTFILCFLFQFNHQRSPSSDDRADTGNSARVAEWGGTWVPPWMILTLRRLIKCLMSLLKSSMISSQTVSLIGRSWGWCMSRSLSAHQVRVKWASLSTVKRKKSAYIHMYINAYTFFYYTHSR